eukprot:9369085-Lingulodinium_polyedra.AAC.1
MEVVCCFTEKDSISKLDASLAQPLTDSARAEALLQSVLICKNVQKPPGTASKMRDAQFLVT